MPPYERFADFNKMTNWIAHFSADGHSPVSRWRLVRLALESPFYSWADLLRIPFGYRFSFSHLWRDAFYKTDLLKQAPRLDVPVFFYLGGRENNCSAPRRHG